MADVHEYRPIRLLVEGMTEETVVRDLLEPYLSDLGYWMIQPVLLNGVSRWKVLEREIRAVLRDTSLHTVSTVIDYYGYPQDAPGMATRPVGGPAERVAFVEAALAEAIGDPRFVPHLVLHETETWVFAAAEQLAVNLASPQLGRKLTAECAKAGGPEWVNDGPATAPSKRLLRHHPAFDKILDGTKAIQDLGLPALREQCPHLDDWLTRLAHRLA